MMRLFFPKKAACWLIGRWPVWEAILAFLIWSCIFGGCCLSLLDSLLTRIPDGCMSLHPDLLHFSPFTACLHTWGWKCVHFFLFRHPPPFQAYFRKAVQFSEPTVESPLGSKYVVFISSFEKGLIFGGPVCSILKSSIFTSDLSSLSSQISSCFLICGALSVHLRYNRFLSFY